jgi:hypothetical protein
MALWAAVAVTVGTPQHVLGLRYGFQVLRRHAVQMPTALRLYVVNHQVVRYRTVRQEVRNAVRPERVAGQIEPGVAALEETARPKHAALPAREGHLGPEATFVTLGHSHQLYP